MADRHEQWTDGVSREPDPRETPRLAAAAPSDPAHDPPPIRVDHWFAGVAGAITFALMVLTTFDVIGRYVFNAPIFGAFEFTEIFMGAIVFFALAAATTGRDHIVVTLVYGVFPHAVRRVLTVFADLVGAALMGLFCWRMWFYAERLYASRETTLELGITKGHVALGICILCGVAALTFLINAVWAAARGRNLIR